VGNIITLEASISSWRASSVESALVARVVGVTLRNTALISAATGISRRIGWIPVLKRMLGVPVIFTR